MGPTTRKTGIAVHLGQVSSINFILYSLVLALRGGVTRMLVSTKMVLCLAIRKIHT